MRIAIASDHGGYEMKDFIVHFLADKGINVTDLGLLNSLQQYDGSDWVEKKGAIYNARLNLWVSYYGYSIYTNNWVYNDLTEMNVNDIETKQDFYAWLGAWFTKLNTTLQNENQTNTVINQNNEVNETTNEIINEYDIDVNQTINNIVNNLKDTNDNIDLNDPKYNIGTNDRNRLQYLIDIPRETIKVFTDNGVGFFLFLPIIIMILGLIL